MHVGLQHEHSPGVLTHRYVYIGSASPIEPSLLICKDDEELRCTELRESFRSVLGVVAWTVLMRVVVVVFVQALQRRAHGFRAKESRKFSFAMRKMKRHKCGFRSITSHHPLKLVGSIDAAFEAQFEEPARPTPRRLAVVLREDDWRMDRKVVMER